MAIPPINGVTDEILESSGGRRPVDTEAFMERVRSRRERMNVQELTPEMVRQAREEGRA
ncbi:MAG TPA: hypothetical protein VEX86_08350 [Longimicrobium sp.]|nr:hypothetical protein [Longimicrobium sp.]